MRKLLTFLVALGAIVFAAVSPVSANGVLILAGPAPVCSQATTVLARYTAAGGSLSGSESPAMTTMICGLVTDGIITGNMNGAGPTGSSACGTQLDALWIFALNNSTNSFINICSTSFTASLVTVTTAASFTADQGWMTTSTGVVGLGYTPSTAAGNYTQNSASFGLCILTADAANAAKADGGTSNNPSAYFGAHLSTNFQYRVNDLTDATASTTNSQGFWAITRTASAARAGYGPSGSSTPIFSDTVASTGLPSSVFYVGARNQGSIALPASHQYAAAFTGSGLTGANYALIAARINTYVKAVNGGNGCF